MNAAELNQASALQVYRRFSSLEDQWWDTLSTETLQKLEDMGLNPQNMKLSGEVLFVLLSLKPCLLISLCALSSDFIEKVVNKSGIMDLYFFEEDVDNQETPKKRAFQILHVERGQTPNFDLGGSYFLVNLRDQKASQHKQQLIQRLSISKTGSKPLMLSEKETSILLDYPTALPEDPESFDGTINEVAYAAEFHAKREIMTTYGARDNEMEKVRKHFHLYKETVEKVSDLNFSLKLCVLC
eukprot:TRINITY_DN2752_c0_g4_i1.p1 TRINITY_DN2752_c0_g4~~TRINITY_DN2752_c0_g4_i1.p1  ORF type:complete len:256 (+),score=48.23 TRINITY_DN2752_c0_g4_i1:47-769(+)